MSSVGSSQVRSPGGESPGFGRKMALHVGNTGDLQLEMPRSMVWKRKAGGKPLTQRKIG